MRRRAGFTLLEMLLALAVAGLLVGASSQLIVSLSHIWAHRTDADSFEEHADGVARFLSRSFAESLGRHQPEWTGGKADAASEQIEALQEAEATSGSGLWKNEGVSMGRIDKDDAITPPTLNWKFFLLPPALGGDAPPASAGVEAWLVFEQGRGLAIVWRDIRNVQPGIVGDEDELLRSSLVSAFVTKLEYLYRDDERKQWLEEEKPREFGGDYKLPDFLRITFEEGGRTSVRMVRVPKDRRTMPIY